jgi:pyridoxamine 5'-phosphate oxidase
VEGPIEQVRAWYEEAVAAGIPDADTMALATATRDGRPSVRFVLLKGIDDEGIRFFTNYESRKGRELDANPHAAVTLYWQSLHRSVRLEGPVERLAPAESDEYFATRERGSQLGAWASDQGTVIDGREQLEDALRAADRRFPGEVPRPGYWGGFRLRPDAVELWQGRPNRLALGAALTLRGTRPRGGWPGTPVRRRRRARAAGRASRRSASARRRR